MLCGGSWKVVVTLSSNSNCIADNTQALCACRQTFSKTFFSGVESSPQLPTHSFKQVCNIRAATIKVGLVRLLKCLNGDM